MSAALILAAAIAAAAPAPPPVRPTHSTGETGPASWSSLYVDGATATASTPNLMTIRPAWTLVVTDNPDGAPIVAIRQNGVVEVNPKLTYTAAAKCFWDAVAVYNLQTPIFRHVPACPRLSNIPHRRRR